MAAMTAITTKKAITVTTTITTITTVTTKKAITVTTTMTTITMRMTIATMRE